MKHSPSVLALTPFVALLGLATLSQLGCSSEGDAAGSGNPSDGASSSGSTYGATIPDEGSAATDKTTVVSSSGAAGTSGGASCTPGLTAKVTALTGAPTGPVYAAGSPDGTTWVAWSRGTGKVFVTPLDASGERRGPDLEVTADGVHGLAAKGGELGMLVRRAPDVLAFVRLSEAGAVLTDAKLVGNSDHATVGSEWFEYQPMFFADGGRVLWTGDRWVAYAPIFRRWPDKIGHTGDTLRVYGANGAPLGGGWDWGCSHSLDVRLAEDGANGFGSMCLSDCYPSKAVLFGKSAAVSKEPTGNCSGTSGAVLGGLTRAAGAFWTAFGSAEGRSARDVALAKLDAKGGVVAKSWITSGGGAASGIHVAPFAGGLVVGWNQGGKGFLQRFDGAAAAKGDAEPLSAALREKDDFVTWRSDGDKRVGWVTTSGASLTLSFLRACD